MAKSAMPLKTETVVTVIVVFLSKSKPYFRIWLRKDRFFAESKHVDIDLSFLACVGHSSSI